jgi:cytochrome c-type biogenesis protein CcmF
LFLLFLTGVGPLLAWRKTSPESLKRNFGWPALLGLVAGAAGVGLGLRNFYVTVCLILCVFVTLTILQEFYRGARVISARSGSNIMSSVVQLTLRNTRRYGGYVVHFGIVLIFIGFSGNAFNQDKQMDMPVGAQLEIGPYKLVHQTFDSTPNTNYTSERATIAVDHEGRQTIMLYPERRFYPSNEESGTMVAVYSTLKEDLYVVYAGRSPETGVPVIHAYLNPLVKWVWMGGMVVVLGTILALVPNRQPVLALTRAAEPIAAGPSQSPAHLPIERRESHD